MIDCWAQTRPEGSLGFPPFCNIISVGRKTPSISIIELWNFDEQPVTKPGPDRAFVFQNYALFPWMTVKDNILFPMQQLQVPKDKQQERLEYLLDISDLKGNEDLYPKQLSGGMKQRTSLVRALATMPKVLLMDEPLGALDLQMRHRLQAEIEEIWIKEKPSVVMVSHDVEEVVYLSDRVIVMSTEQGKIILDKKIELPRPRDRESNAYKNLVKEISDTISKIPPRRANIDENNRRNEHEKQ